MSVLEWQRHDIIWTPNSYTANSVEEVLNVAVGDLVGLIICRTTTAFDGTGTAAKFELGDDGDADRYVDDGELEETSVSAATSIIRAAGASGGGYVLYRSHLYTTANTIDVNFTAATGADGTTGAVQISIWVAHNIWLQ